MNQPCSNPSAVILDTETTAAKETPERKIEVIELAYRDIHTRELFVQRYKPDMPPQWGALAIHGITMQELEGCPPSLYAYDHAPTADTYWIGHNIDFDWRALGEPAGVKRICTLALARYLWPQLDSHTLSACAYYALGATPAIRERLRSAHSALADIALCRDILLIMLEAMRDKAPTSLDALWAMSEEARIPRTFTFGKFKGQPIKAADRGYARWYKSQPDPDPYLLEAFKREGLL